MAVQKYDEATLWWAGFEKAVAKWRALATYAVTQEYLLRRAEARRSPLVRSFRREVDLAHDTLLIVRENIKSLARAATACEMGGHIYDEEHEQREWARTHEMEDNGYNGD